MKREVITHIKLTADEGKVLSNGKHYHDEIHIVNAADEKSWHEITKEEYEAILAEKENEEAE